jgi:PAS domain S-box-containing protein
MNWLPSRLWARLNLAARLSLVVALSTIFAAMGAAYQSSQYIVHKTQIELSAEYNMQMDMLESVVISAAFDSRKNDHNFDFERLIDVITKFKYGNDITQISFRDTSDMAAFSQDIIIKLEAPIFFSRWCGLELIKFNRPIIVEGLYYGLISLSMSPNRILNQAWKNYLYLVQVISISLVIILFSMWFVLYKTLSPLLALAEANKTLGGGDLSVRVEIAGSPELRTILSGFNQLASSFQSTLDELQESESRFRQLAESLPQLVWTCRPDGPCDYLSPQWIKFTGVPEGQQLGFGWLEQLHPDDSAPAMAAWGAAVASGEDFRAEFRIRRHDGEYRWFDTRAVRFHDAQGQVVKWFGSNTDITERKRTEDALRESEERFRAIFKHSTVGMSLTATDGKLLRINKAFADMLGYSIDKVKQLNFAQITYPDDIAESRECIRLLLAGEQTEYRMEKRYIHKSGDIVWVDVSTTLLRNEQGSPRYFITCIVDVTERKQADEEKIKLQSQLLQAQKMESIGSLAGGIAHDLNNILFPISGLSEMLLEDIPPENPVYENIKQIHKSAQRGGDLVKQILAFSRQSRPQKLPIRIQPILKEVMKLSRSTIPMNIEITSNIKHDCGLTSADPTQIHQIAMNLITNAYHALEAKGGTINIELNEMLFEKDDFTKPGNYACITVADNGVGIDRTQIDKIFDPYFTTKELGKGTGLGLSVVHGIVKEHGGDIRVYSEVGKGTTFNVYLPLLEASKDSEAATASKIHPTGRERILLVDDEAPIAKMLQLILERLGYQVTIRTSSTDALEVFRFNPSTFDLLISDRGMPNMTGEQLARELISIRPEIPIIICSGFSDENDEKHARAIGVKGFLKKPVATGDLAEMVRKVMDDVKDATR